MSDLDAIMHKLEDLAEAVASLQDALGVLLEAQRPFPPPAPPAPAPTTVASYAQMYEEMPATPAPDTPPPGPTPPAPGRLKRWFTREEPA